MKTAVMKRMHSQLPRDLHLKLQSLLLKLPKKRRAPTVTAQMNLMMNQHPRRLPNQYIKLHTGLCPSFVMRSNEKKTRNPSEPVCSTYFMGYKDGSKVNKNKAFTKWDDDLGRKEKEKDLNQMKRYYTTVCVIVPNK